MIKVLLNAKYSVLLFVVILFIPQNRFGMNNHQLVVIVSDSSGMKLMGANVFLEGTNNGASTDSNGVAYLFNIPTGSYTLIVSYIGYESAEESLSFPANNGDTLNVNLSTEETNLESIIVTSTRSTRSIEDEPTRISVISAEELDENAMMNSANIGELLRETTGVQVQQLSQNTSNAVIRIHGLDGKYTQILKDGFPLYSGFASSMSILQIPPLDLRQIEVIKGSNSTLYGGGAVGGIINLISKIPTKNFLLDLMFNQTSTLGTTINGFSSGMVDDFGYTLYLSGNYQKEKDTDDDNFTNIPNVKSYSINPTLYYNFSNSASLYFRLNVTHDERKGGDVLIFDENSSEEHFFEKNKTDRLSTQTNFEYMLSPSSKIIFKNSFSFFERELNIPDYRFGGDQLNHFSELTYITEGKTFSWVFGADLRNEDFNDAYSTLSYQHGYSHNTIGSFIQNTCSITEQDILESGIRADYNNQYGWFVLPRIAYLHKFSKNILSRFSTGFGYILPSIFTEEAEEKYFRDIQPIDDNIAAERSFSIDWDINFNYVFDNHFFLSFDQLFFYNIISNSLMLTEYENESSYQFVNATGPTTGRGFETNIKAGYRDFTCYLNYTYNDVIIENLNREYVKPLTPYHTVGTSIVYEEEENWTIGFELYYTGSQYMSSGVKTSDYWMAGFMIMKKIENVSLFINFENFTDTKQSDYQQLVNPPRKNPTFNEIWAPIDGFVFNGGFKISL